MERASRQPLTVGNRLKKLRAMSADELWTRLRYQAYCRRERARHARGLLSAGGLRPALVPGIARVPDWQTTLLETRRQRRPRFYAGAEQLPATRALYRERYRDEHRAMRDDAARAMRHEFSFFGGTYTYGERVDWHADPVTRAPWPKVYHRDVPVHGGDVGYGDVKHVWELSRHQFLMDLARAWAVDGDARAASAMRTLVFDWREQNPVGTGVAWSCALEPAFRVLSWLWAYHLTLDDPAFDRDSHLQWLEGFHDHGWFLYRHLEYYTSPFNHLAGEACALYALGVLFPEFAEAARWRAHGREVLESRLGTQFYPDGGSVEQSTFYHHATTGFYLLAALLGRENGEEFAPPVWDALARALEFSANLQQPDGTTPRIGGADDGKPIRLEQRPLWDFRPYQAIGAVVFDRPDFKASAGRFFEDALWLLGPDGLARFDRLAETFPSGTSRVHGASGYVVLRSAWSQHADYVCFDCGEQAAGLRRDAIPSAAHGHADCLSILVWRGGRPVLVDAGLYCYNGPKPWQDHFRETAAHNTARIDGVDQALHINKMAWAYTYRARLEGYELGPAGGWALGSHDGYQRLPAGPVIHRRAVWARPRGYLIVCDRFEGSGRHELELTFQFAPGSLRVCGDRVEFGDVASLHWFAPVTLTPRVDEGGTAPDGGWIAPSLGVKQAAPRLVLGATIEPPLTVITILADQSPQPLRVYREPGGRIVVSGAGWTDVISADGLAQRADDGAMADALVAAWRMDGNTPVPDGRIDRTVAPHRASRQAE